MAQYISDYPETVANQTVLELGAGLGLPSIVATYQNAKFIHTTDRTSAIPLLDENIRRNANRDVNVKVAAFDWYTDKVPQKYQVKQLFRQYNCASYLALQQVSHCGEAGPQ